MPNGLQFFILGLLGSIISGPVVLRWLRKNSVVDQPNERSSHSVATPRGGGIGLLVPFFLVMPFWATGTSWMAQIAVVVACALILMIISFVDDLSGLSAKARFVVQLGSAVTAVTILGWRGGAGMASHQWLLVTVLSIFWVTGYTNAFNFMDGINGIAASQAAVTGFGTGLIALWGGLPAEHPVVVMSFVVSGGAIGFLPYNFPRARMFMGDAGSATLGFLLAVMAYWVVAECGLKFALPLLAMHLNFGMDTAITLFRRIARGDRWHEPHREHFYQRLVRSGFSHAMVTGVETFMQVLVLATLPFVIRHDTGVLGLHLIGWGLGWGLFFLIAELVFRRKMCAD